MIILPLVNYNNEDIPLEFRVFFSEVLVKFRKFRSVFVNKRDVLKYISNSIQNNYEFKMPSLLSTFDSVCIGSYFENYNFLLFKDLSGAGFFYILQHNNGSSGFYLPDSKILSIPNSMYGFFRENENRPRLELLLQDYLERCSNVSHAVLSGFIDGYSRPYHYFYDRLPSLLYLLKNFPKVRTYSLSNTFFPGDLSREIYSINEINNITKNGGRFFYQTFRFSGSKLFDLNKPVLRYTSQKQDLFYLKPFVKDYTFIWIGLCEEKRSWGGKVDALLNIISMSLLILKNPIFIFDGMTCPTPESSKVFREKNCEKEIKIINSILERFCDISYIDLIGAKSDKKISFGQIVDFFFSSALTDSIWPSHFGFSKGVAYASTIANVETHNHPLAYIVPKKYIQDANDGIDNWARKGYEIDHNALCFFVNNGLLFTADLKNKINKYGVFNNVNFDNLMIENLVGSDRERLVLELEEEKIISLYSKSLEFKEQQAFNVYFNSYFFKISFLCDEGVEFSPFLIFYSCSGEEVDIVKFKNRVINTYEVKKNALYYRVFAVIKGYGEVEYHGFYAQPLL